MRSNETNVTILNFQDSIFEVKGIVKDDNLGGNLLTEQLIKYYIEEFENETGIKIKNNQKAYNRIKKECEKCKNELSSSKVYSIDLDAFAEGEDLNIDKYLFDEIILLLEKVLEYSSLTKNQFDEIILTTKISKIENLVLLDVLPLSLGIDKGDGIMEIIIPRNTTIPFEKTITLKSINNSSFN